MHVPRPCLAEVSVTPADLGAGAADGVLVRDRVCLGAACVDIEVMAALHMDDKPFLVMPNDGIVGLAMRSLAASPLCSFLGRLMEGSSNVVPQFGIFLGVDRGQVYFGGHDTRHLTAPIKWFPVDRPDSGYWQVAVRAVRVGIRTVNDCRDGCHAVVDSGASRLGVQDPNLEPLRAAPASGPGPEGRCQGPNLTFDLGGMALTLPVEDYADAPASPSSARWTWTRGTSPASTPSERPCSAATTPPSTGRTSAWASRPQRGARRPLREPPGKSRERDLLSERSFDGALSLMVPCSLLVRGPELCIALDGNQSPA